MHGIPLKDGLEEAAVEFVSFNQLRDVWIGMANDGEREEFGDNPLQCAFDAIVLRR